jgi:hypothetical protein
LLCICPYWAEWPCWSAKHGGSVMVATRINVLVGAKGRSRAWDCVADFNVCGIAVSGMPGPFSVFLLGAAGEN